MRTIVNLDKKLMNPIMQKVLVFIVVILTVWTVGLCRSGSKKILVAYYSMTGYTKQMAEAAAEGARSVKGVEVKLLSVKNAKTADVLWADAVILGTPVHNANVALPMQEFINKWPIEGTPMKNKIGAAFVSAGGISSGEELTMMKIIHSMLIFNMIIVGGSDWKSPFGASAITEETPFDNTFKTKKVNPYFLKKAKNLGERVARLLLRFNRAQN
jgi:NAD(P)H dehydrogenase (quinone)